MCKAIYYSEEQSKIYLFQYGEDVTTVENYELEAQELELEDADRLIEEYLNMLKKEEDRRKKYEDWLSK
jgi:hypothetical protein